LTDKNKQTTHLESLADGDAVESGSGGGSLLFVSSLVLDTVLSEQAVPQPQLLVVNGRQVLQQVVDLGEHGRHAGLLGPHGLVQKRATHLTNNTIPVRSPLGISGVVGEHNGVEDVRIEGNLQKGDKGQRRTKDKGGQRWMRTTVFDVEFQKDKTKAKKKEYTPWEGCPCSGSSPY